MRHSSPAAEKSTALHGAHDEASCVEQPFPYHPLEDDEVAVGVSGSFKDGPSRWC